MRKAMIWVCLFQLILAGATWSQATTGSIVGRVTDQSEAPVSGAKVTAVNEQTGVKYPGKTDTDGNYAVYGLPPGTYTIAAERDGFQSSAISGVLLVIDQKQLLNFGLKVGAVTETVMVTAAPTMLQTQSVETGEVIQSHEILDLPLLGRNFYDLTILTAGVVQVGGSINALSFAVNGQREYANSIQIDGIESTTNRTQDITATPSVDSIEEFKVSTSAYSAQFGKAAGADIAIQTKAGGKSYHGTAYEFFRPNFLAAKSFAFQGAKNPPPVLKRHNYGGTLGGPVIRKKTFFFASYEGTHETNAYDYVFFTPPLNQIKVLPDGSVDLSGLVDPSSGKQIPVYDPAVSVNCYGGCYKQFAGNSIPANRVSTAGLNTLMKFFPQPNLPGTSHGWFDNFQVHSPVTFHQKLADARLDHNFSDNDRLSFVYHYNNSDQLVTDPYTGHNVVGGGGDQSNYQTSGAQQYVLTETHLFSTRFLNEARVGYVYYNLEQYSPINGQDLSSKYGVGNIFVPGYPATAAYPWIFMGLGEQIGGSTYKPFLIEDNNFQLSDNVILSQLGKHELRFGGGFRRLNSHPNFSFFPTGFFYFGGPYAAMTSDWSYTSPLNDFSGATLYGNGGSDIADLILGLPLDVQRGLQLTKPYTRSWEMDYYAEDTFKVNRRLTLVLGMRYEFQAPYTEAGNNASNYDPKTDSLLLAGRGANSAGLMNTRWNDFAPRVGVVFQWDPKTVVRAGYGMYYSPENDGREDILTKNYPFATQQVFTDNPYNGPASPTQPFTYIMDIGVPRSTAIPIPAGASNIPTSTISNGSLETSYYVNPNMKSGYSQLFNGAVQREIGSNFNVEVAYVGSRSHRLSYQIGNINRNNVVTANLGKIQALNDAGWGSYNSLQVKVTKRVSRNLDFLAAYTYGHNIDNGPSPFNLGHINSDNPQDPHNLNQEIASADDDIRHSFVFSGLYRLPIGRGQAFFSNWGRMPELLLGGWQFNGIFRSQTGTPINIIRNGSNVGYEGLRPNLIGKPGLPNGQRTLDVYFNNFVCKPSNPPQPCPSNAAWDVSPFVMNSSNAVGNAGRNLITGPGFVNADTSLFKDFEIKEGMKLQTRLEAFNTFNTPHFSNPGGDIGDSSSFGKITRTYGNMRIMQLAVKFIF